MLVAVIENPTRVDEIVATRARLVIETDLAHAGKTPLRSSERIGVYVPEDQGSRAQNPGGSTQCKILDSKVRARQYRERSAALLRLSPGVAVDRQARRIPSFQ